MKKMIYTLDYLKQEAELIAGHWNGSDEKYVDGSGEARTEEEAGMAVDLLTKIKEIEELVKTLGI